MESLILMTTAKTVMQILNLNPGGPPPKKKSRLKIHMVSWRWNVDLKPRLFSKQRSSQRKTKGQQLKGKIVSALFHTFWHFPALFHTFSEFFRIFPPGLFLKVKGFYYSFSSKRRKENKREKKKKTKSFCTLVVARLSSSYPEGLRRTN